MNFNIHPFVRFIAKTTYFINDTDLVARDCHCLYILSGHGAFVTKERIYNLEPNTLIYWSYGMTYRITSKSNDLLFYTLNFDFNSNFMHIPTMAPCAEADYDPKRNISSIEDNTGELFSGVVHIPNAIWAENELRTLYNEALEKRWDILRFKAHF